MNLMRFLLFMLIYSLAYGAMVRAFGLWAAFVLVVVGYAVVILVYAWLGQGEGRP